MRRDLLRLALAVAALAALGCAPEVTTPTPTAAALGRIQGTFLLTAGPTPTCTAVSLCPAPYLQPEVRANITIARLDGTVSYRTRTDPAGAFHIDVPAGIYTVSTPTQNEPGVYSLRVTVPPGGTVSVSLEITEP